MAFNRRFEFQFALITAPSKDGIKVDAAKLKSIRENFNLPKPGRLKINIPGSSIQDSLVQIGESLVPMPAINWPGAGAWRMTWTPLRFDVYMSVLAYEEILGQSVELSEALERILPCLSFAAETLAEMQCVVHRPVLIVSAERDLTEEEQWRVLTRLGERSLAPAIVDAVRAKLVSDWSLRTDWAQDVRLPSGPMPMHRIESLGTRVGFSGVTRQVTFSAQWDINTSPARGVERISLADLEGFYFEAVRWLGPRLSEVKGVLT